MSHEHDAELGRDGVDIVNIVRLLDFDPIQLVWMV
jgi:hypothetical protein